MEGSTFDVWLGVKLKSLGTDENVFGDYIKSILEGDESQEEKIEALEGILVEISPTDGVTQNEICQEIWKQWELYREADAACKRQKADEAVSVDIQIARIMEQQALCVVPQKKQTEEEKKLKQSILTQYAEVSDGEEEEDDAEGPDLSEDRAGGLLSRNTNAEDVMKLEKLKKESLRQDSQKKKDKDKEDREKQKQQQLDRKEKEKKRTQKGEKKR
nr:EOG090X0H15 [Chydorus sphaericus]